MPEVKLKFTTDHSQVDSSVSKIKGSLASLKGGLGEFAGGFGLSMPAVGMAGLAGAITGATAALAAGIKNVTEQVSALKDLSDITSTNVTILRIFQEAVALAGGNAEAFKSIMEKFMGVMGEPNDKILKWLDKFNLSLTKLQAMNTYEQIKRISDAINQLGSDSEKQRASIDFFGRGNAGNMVRVSQDFAGNMNKALVSLGRMPVLMEHMAEDTESTGDVWDRISVKWDQFITGFMVTFVPGVKKVADTISGIDFTPLGVFFGGLTRIVLNIPKLFVSFGVDMIAFWIRVIKEIFVFLKFQTETYFSALVQKLIDLDKTFSLGLLSGSLGVKAPTVVPYEEQKMALLGEQRRLFDWTRDTFKTIGEAFTNPDKILEENKPGKMVLSELITGKNDILDAVQNKLGQFGDYVKKGEFKKDFKSFLDGWAKDNKEIKKAQEDRIKQEKEFNERLSEETAEGQRIQHWIDNFLGLKVDWKEVDMLQRHELPRIEPVLGALASVGGARAEVPAFSVIDFQKESIRLQRETAMNTRRMSTTLDAVQLGFR